MDPQRKAIIEALLMQGQVSPADMYQNSINNEMRDPRGAPAARERYLAGNPVAAEPFNALESMSAPPQQALGRMAQPAPPNPGEPAADEAYDALAQRLQMLTPQQRQQVMDYVNQGAPIDQAIDAVSDMNAITRGQ